MSFASGRLLDGRYQLHAVLGRGGMATVWAGIDTRLDRPVAVKLLDAMAVSDASVMRAFDREARVVARLAHPNIVAVYDVGSDRGMPYLVMELVEGETLQRRLATAPLPVAQVVTIADQVCAALVSAHAAGVVHGDIKPDNVMLTRTGSAKVCDFGIARLQLATPASQTPSATAVGTSEYMSPEQAMGGNVDARTDLYALGCVIYAMLSGAPPFTGHPARVLWQQVHQSPPPMVYRPDVTPQLESLLTGLLAKDPADRPDSAAEVRARLADLSRPFGAEPATHQPASDVRPPVYARAAVVTPTRTMPAVDVAAIDRPARTGFRLGPSGIVGVAIGAAVITALVIAILLAMHPAQPIGAGSPSQSSGPGASPSTNGPSTTPTASATSTDGVRAAIDSQVQAGQLTQDDAHSLTDKLDDVDRDLSKGRTDRAAGRLSDLRDQLSGLLQDDKITQAGYDAILSAIDSLATSLG